MLALLQTGSRSRVPVVPEKRFLIRWRDGIAHPIIALIVIGTLSYQLFAPGNALAQLAEDATPDRVHDPQAVRIYTLTLDEYERVEPLLQNAGVRILTNTVASVQDAGATNDQPVSEEDSLPAHATTPHEALIPSDSALVPVPHRQPERERRDDDSADAVVNLLVDLTTTDWSSREAAIVLFVGIGAVVVITVIAYAGVALYQLLSGQAEQSYWTVLQTRAEGIAGRSHRGGLYGVQLATGFDHGGVRTGAVFETGYLRTHLKSRDATQSVRAEGAYAMAGGGAYWRFGDHVRNPSQFGIELLAGAMDHSQVELVSVARASLGFGIGSHGRLGVTIGALLVDLDPKDGFLTHNRHFSTLIGLETGFRF